MTTNNALPSEGAEKTLGQILRGAREAQGLSENAVRQETGVSNEYLRRLEDDELKTPSASVLWKLSEYYQIDPKPLLIMAGCIVKKIKP
jgi:transcriptional regulator with XRE-family HTH domain